MIPLFDLHCDTFSEAFKQGISLCSSSLHISLDKIGCFSPYIQACAIWSDCRYSDEEAYLKYKENIAFIKNQGIQFSKSPLITSSPTFLLAVEDARILCNHISRLDELFNDGVKILTLCWKGESCIGGGWDTKSPLTEFGKSVVLKCAEKGIVVDLSHSSQNVQAQVFELTKSFVFSPIYSHSNSFSVCKHKRNITDDFFGQVISERGLVGISLFPEHLSNTGYADLNSAVKHIYHFLSLGGENNISLGCDFDGVNSLPNGIRNISDLSRLYDLLNKEFGSDVTDKIFFYNAYNYFSEKFPERR